jgi:hypothetical protein
MGAGDAGLQLAVAVFTLIVSVVALVVLFKLPGYMQRQEKRMEHIAKAADELPSIIGYNCRKMTEEQTLVARAACKSLNKGIKPESPKGADGATEGG